MSRAGKPCTSGSRSPFMPTATRAWRPSNTADGREPDREAVHRAADDLVGIGVDPGPPQEVGERHPPPGGVADQVAADLVRDALQGEVGLDHRQGGQLVPGELQGMVDLAGDPQPPGVDVDGRRSEQAGVDPVEVGVGYHDRAHPGHADRVGRGGRRHRVGHRRQGDPAAAGDGRPGGPAGDRRRRRPRPARRRPRSRCRKARRLT